MTDDKRFIIRDSDYAWVDTYTRYVVEVEDAFDLLNELHQKNKMLSMKMSEVNTKYRLLKQFSDDTDPNEAVSHVLHELMMITKEYR